MAAELVKLSDVVDELSISSYDSDRKKYLAYTFFAKRTFLDLHLNVISKVTRTFIKVDQRTKTAKFPLDFYKWGTICRVDDCNNIIPLSKNEYLNITAEIVKETCKDAKCKVCGNSASEVCDEVQNYQTITETITMSLQTGTTCLYKIDVSLFPFSFTYRIVGYDLNNESVLSTSIITSQLELDNYFIGLGFLKQSNTVYYISDTNIWSHFYFSVNGTTNIYSIEVADSNCNPVFEDTDYIKTTQIKTCANGDIIQRVTEPINIATEGIERCDYSVQISRGEQTICDYEIDFNPILENCDYCFDFAGLTYPINNVTVNIAGVYYNSGVIANYAALKAWMESLGFVNANPLTTIFCLNDSTFVVSNITLNYLVRIDTVDVEASGCSPFAGQFPFYIYFYTKNGNQVDVNTIIYDQGDLDAFFTSIGFTNSGGNIYTQDDSSDVYGEVAYGIYDQSSPDYNPTSILFDTGSPDSCTEIEALQYPVTIVSYIKNGTTVVDGSVVATELALINYFGNLGFVFIGDGTFKISQTTDVYTSIIYSDAIGQLTELFAPSGCTNLSDSSVEMITKDSTLCNVPVRECGCIIESDEVIATIKSSCGCLLQCCVDEICSTPTMKAWNKAGTYQIDEKRGIIHLNDYDADSILLNYYTDGSEGGQYYVIDIAVPAMLKGIFARSLEFDIRMPENKIKGAFNRYEKEKDELYILLNPMILAECARAMRSVIRWGGATVTNVVK